MARKDQRRRKEKQFKRANRQRLESARAEAAEVERLREECRERGLDFVTFEIVHEAMADPLLEALPEADQEEIQRVGRELFRDAAPLKDALEGLVARHPHIPTLWNYLMVSVAAAGDSQRAEQLAEETCRRFPAYLFGVAQWVITLLDQERVEEATRVLDGRLGLAKWWPERRVYHATEFVVFNAMLGLYFLKTGDRKAAGKQLELVMDVLPDHPAAQALERGVVLEAIRLLAEESRGDLSLLRDPGAPAQTRRVRGAAGAA